jgi:aryl-alcohol dehydrogenase-like predicted oxidoreductase
MEYVPMGRSGLKVSPAALGGMNFGADSSSPADEHESRRIIDAFLDSGHNVIDTANAYRGGQSEEVIGRAIKDRRESVVLATKGGMPSGPGPNRRGLSRANLLASVETSLRKLQTDYIDLYQCHVWDPTTPVEEFMSVLNGLVQAGKVRYVGVSNFTAAQIVECQWAAARAGGAPLTTLQPHYSLLAREIEAEILPVCASQGIGTLTYGPLGGGVLAGRYQRGAEPSSDDRLGQWKSMPVAQPVKWADDLLAERNFDIADTVKAIAGELGTTMTAVALAWTTRRPGITSVIIGPRTVEQLEQNLAGFELDLPAEAVERLDEASKPTNVPTTGQMGVVG